MSKSYIRLGFLVLATTRPNGVGPGAILATYSTIPRQYRRHYSREQDPPNLNLNFRFVNTEIVHLIVIITGSAGRILILILRASDDPDYQPHTALFLHSLKVAVSN